MSKRLFVWLAMIVAGGVQAMDAPVGDAQVGANKAIPCSGCHGMDGNSPAPEWPSLGGQSADYVYRQTVMFRDGGRVNALMEPFVVGLSDQDIADISAHFATLTTTPGVADDSPIQGIAGVDDTYANLGQAIYRGGVPAAGVPACQACHGPSGRGIPGAGYPAVAGQHAVYNAARLNFFHSGQHYGNDNDPSTIMVTIAQRLQPVQIDALATYMEGLHRADPAAQAELAAARNESALVPATQALDPADAPVPDMDAEDAADAGADAAPEIDAEPADEADEADTAQPDEDTTAAEPDSDDSNDPGT
ncbi:MAG: cytochrome c4 [Xanthomonadales bacterium]|nr:cytochrome c4 [Xanthomonadales bacterium]